MSNGRTFDYGGKVSLSVGDTLWSNLSVPLLKIVSDDAGQHDFMYAACSQEMYRIEYGIEEPHPNCHDNMKSALRSIGVQTGDHLPTPFNVFQNTRVQPDGTLVLAPPTTRPGDSTVFEALADISIALSACAAAICNGGTAKPVAYEIL